MRNTLLYAFSTGANWYDEIFGKADAEKAIERFARNLKWIVEGDNWCRAVGECGLRRTKL